MKPAAALKVPAEFTIDTLAEYQPIDLPVAKLAEGMVLLDEFDTPSAVIDHRMKATRGTGTRKYMLVDLDDNGRHIEHAFAANGTVRVAAA